LIFRSNKGLLLKNNTFKWRNKMSMATESHGKTRQRRFSRIYLDEQGSELDDTKLVEESDNAVDILVNTINIRVDGEDVPFSYKAIPYNTIVKLACEALYDRLTRAVHAAKPVASDTESAIKVMEATYEVIRSGKAKKGRRGGGGGRVFDADAFRARFKPALIAGAKGNNIKFNDAAVERVVESMVSKSGKERQEILQKRYFKDPYFKVVWDKPVIEKKKAAIKAGEVESAFSDLM
jgi:hypothetical protein